MSERKMTSVFERYLTVWVALCIVGGVVLWKLAPNLAKTLDGMKPLDAFERLGVDGI